jgi:hypothetical protein
VLTLCHLCPTGYNRLLVAFKQADSKGDGWLDRSEWTAGAAALGQFINLECQGTSDEFDDIVLCPQATQAATSMSQSTSPIPSSKQKSTSRSGSSKPKSASRPSSSKPGTRPGSAQPSRSTTPQPSRSDGGDAADDNGGGGGGGGEHRISFASLCTWFVRRLEVQDGTVTEGLSRHVHALSEPWEVSRVHTRAH